MTTVPSDLRGLLGEYESYVDDVMTEGGAVDWERLRSELIATGQWSHAAADQLILLVRNYGSFMLRNAAALAIATYIEDGELGF